MDGDQTERLLTVEEVARTLRCSRGRVESLIAKGELRAIQIGQLERVAESDLVRFVQGDRVRE
jgi:excisionase family DNA binding protein